MAVKTLDKAILDRIDRWLCSDRLKRRKQAYFDAPRKVCSERARLAMESWKETEGEDIEVRRAKLVEKILEGIPIVIREDQLVAGSQTTDITGADPWLDLSGSYIPRLSAGGELRMMSPVTEGLLSEEDRKVLVECASFFDGKTGGDAARQVRNDLMGTWIADLQEVNGVMPFETQFPHVFMGMPTFDKVLTDGLRAIIGKAEAGIQRFREQKETDVDKLYFWQSVVIVCEAVCVYAKRYAQLAREMAHKEKYDERKRQLEEMAKVCDRVPENPARTFYEAVQSVMLIMVALRLEQTEFSYILGRADQYLYPYFESDIREGRITVEQVAELIGELLQSLERFVTAGVDNFGQEHFQQSATSINLNLGGVDSQGRDACNELTYIFLHVEGEVKCVSPWLTFRWNPATPHYMMLKALDCNRKTRGGQPQFVSDVHAIEYLTNTGVPLEEARDYGVVGCVELASPRRHCALIASIMVNSPLWLEVTLHNGVAPVNGKRIGLETGDPRSFRTSNDLLEAYKKQLQFGISRLIWETFVELGAIVKAYRQPLASSLLPGCVDRGHDASCLEEHRGSMAYGVDRGIVDVADCLIAIKKLVYDEKRLTMDELLTALDSNFEGERGEEIRQMCLAAPKYGNMIDEVDLLVRELGTFSVNTINSMSAVIPGAPFYRSYRPGAAWHYWAGKRIGALPNGRKAFEPLYDGSLSPMRGGDKRGTTAVLQSALKAGFKETCGSVLNQKFSRTVVQSPESLEKLAILTETFLRAGGSHIQYNLVDKETLLDAKKHPEMHRDLIVRIAGYSAYFVHLTPEVQDDIIARTEQEVS